jgi:hypothetical protein
LEQAEPARYNSNRHSIQEAFMRIIRSLAFAAAGLAALSPAAFADVQLTIQNGRVSLAATDATVRQILTEWARVGQTRVVNLERIPGGPVTLQLKDVSEEQAIDVVLRSVSGYVLAPRSTVVENASRFDRIIVMPTSVAPAVPAAARGVPPSAQPAFPPQFPVPMPQPGADEDDDDRVPNVVAPPPNRGPVFSTFPQPQVVNPQQQPVQMPMPGIYTPPPPQPVQGGSPAMVPQHQQEAPSQQAAPSPYPTSPFGGVAVPGMMVPTPTAAPGQPQRPQAQPGVLRRSPPE